jgi:hypothetical protein
MGNGEWERGMGTEVGTEVGTRTAIIKKHHLKKGISSLYVCMVKKYNLYSVGLTDRKLCVSTKYKLEKTKKQLSYTFNKFISCTHSTMFNLL